LFCAAAVCGFSTFAPSDASAATPATQVLLDVGGSAVGAWRSDPGPVSSAPTSVGSIGTAIDTSGVEAPAPAAVYASYRAGRFFSYRIGGLIPGATYAVRLHFAEPTATGPKQRVFNVQIDGAPALANVDVFALGKAQNRAVALVAQATANATGHLTLTFVGHGSENAIVSGIEVQRVVFIRIGGPAVGAWQSDPGPVSGSTNTYITGAAIDTSGVTQPAPQAVYQSSRYGQNFAYAIAGLAPGAVFTVRLHFADPYCWFVGCRPFNISINGAPSAWNFDIFALAGVQNRAVTRSFGTNANSAGQILINFAGLNSTDPTLSGIEIQPAGFVPASAVDNPTSHYDGYRTSWNPQEQALTAANVNVASFGLLRTLAVDGSVDAQPLVVSGVQIPNSKVRHDLVIVATAKDSMYAFDANSGALIWQRSMLGSGERSLTISDVGNCEDTVPDIGIMGTPVVDRVAGAVYVDVPTYSSVTASYHHRLHAIALTSGVDLVTPVEVTGSVAATGQTFNTQFQRQRAGLVLANGNVYVAFSSFCDYNPDTSNDPVVGWVMGFNAATLAPLSTGDPFSTSDLDSVWQGGVAPAVDPQGNLYFATGNGPYDGGANMDNSIIKVSPNLTRLDSFTTRNQANESAADLDAASAGILLLPDQPGTYPHIALHEGKVPAVRALNRDYLGGYSGGLGNPEAVLTYAYTTPCDPTVSVACADSTGNQSQSGGVWGGIAYYVGPNAQQYVVVADAASYAHSFAFGTNGSVTLVPATQTNVTLPNEGGATPLVTSNGTLAGSAVVWLVNRADPTFTLEAYDASTMNLIYAAYAGQWDSPAADSMLVPTVANGQLFIGSQVLNSSGTLVGGQVAVYGLLRPVTPFPDARGVAREAARTTSPAPIRLAGPVVYGPGSRIIARAQTQRIPPAVVVPHAAHAFYGTLRSNEAGIMTFELRGGRVVRVDAREAIRRGIYSRDIRIGKNCYVAANRTPGSATLTAVSISHTHRPLRKLPADR
jgi:hypothetical protein